MMILTLSHPQAKPALLVLIGCALAGHLLARRDEERDLRERLYRAEEQQQRALTALHDQHLRMGHDLRAAQQSEARYRHEVQRTDATLRLTHRALLETTWDLVQARHRLRVLEQGQVAG